MTKYALCIWACGHVWSYFRRGFIVKTHILVQTKHNRFNSNQLLFSFALNKIHNSTQLRNYHKNNMTGKTYKPLKSWIYDVKSDALEEIIGTNRTEVINRRRKGLSSSFHFTFCLVFLYENYFGGSIVLERSFRVSISRSDRNGLAWLITPVTQTADRRSTCRGQSGNLHEDGLPTLPVWAIWDSEYCPAKWESIQNLPIQF